jgi:hypothetical protein
MTDKRYNQYAIKSLIVKDKDELGEETTWGIVFYDSVKNKSVEKELKKLLREAQKNEQ